MRLDLIAQAAAGNKYFKLRPFVELAQTRQVPRLVSFGGAWSNHLHALAEFGAASGLETVGIVRGEPHEPDTPTLRDAQANGMTVLKVGRVEYARRYEQAYHSELEQRFAPCVIVPEGGATADAALSCADIATIILQQAPDVGQVVVAVGTGTTLAGIVYGLSLPQTQQVRVHGVSALKGALDIDTNVATVLQSLGVQRPVPWRLHHEYHGGGFARVNAELREFMLAFEGQQQIPLDPVYTLKAMYATGQLLRRGELDDAVRTVVVHSGGLQGRRGYSFIRAAGPTAAT